MEIVIIFIQVLALLQIASCQDPCVDNYPQSTCSGYESVNSCHIVSDDCKRTCGYCSPVPSTPNGLFGIIGCVDSSAQCQTLANTGLCALYPNLRIACPASCNSCNGGFPVLAIPKKGSWSKWGHFGKCSVSCGNGVRTRHRKCVGNNCAGSSSSTQKCSAGTCPTGRWSSWGRYSVCSKDCGGGTQTRKRNCISGSLCIGPKTSTRTCNSHPCKACSDSASYCLQMILHAPQLCIVSESVQDSCRKTCDKCEEQTTCKWSSWGNYGTCTVKCGGGKQTRKRTKVSGSSCKGHSSSSRTCNTHPCKGRWSSWGSYSACSEDCGGGTQTRKRNCISGSLCIGPQTSTRKCNSHPCKDKVVSRWSAWGSYATCSKDCGTGSQTRKRYCKFGNACKGAKTFTRKCNTHPCKGSWSSWTVGKCSKTCGEGVRTYTRKCSKYSCVGQGIKKRKCNERKCFGNWGPWISVSSCSKSCGGGLIEKIRKCSTKHCNGKAPKKTEKCNVHACTTSSSWSTCTKSCGIGSQSRRIHSGQLEFRSCSNHLCRHAACIGDKKPRRGIPHACCKVEKSSNGRITCGNPILEGRIIGGTSAKAKQWPWMVAIRMGRHFCAGVIISHRFVLSAGHCFVDLNGNKRDTRDFRLQFGMLRLSQDGATGTVTIGVKKLILHPELDYPRADIAILELKSSLKFNSFIQPICLPGGEITPIDTKCYATGWGESQFSNQTTDNLQEVGLQNLDPEVCKAAYKKSEQMNEYFPFINKDKRTLCAGSIDKLTDSCLGDSGGPLACQRCSSCAWYLAGLVSFGPYPCAERGVPGIYTRILDYENWIASVTGTPKPSKSCSMKIGP